jgi:hypothetical protein
MLFVLIIFVHYDTDLIMDKKQAWRPDAKVIKDENLHVWWRFYSKSCRQSRTLSQFQGCSASQWLHGALVKRLDMHCNTVSTSWKWIKLFTFASVNVSHCTDISKKTKSTVRSFPNLIDIDNANAIAASCTDHRQNEKTPIDFPEWNNSNIYLDAKSCPIHTQVNEFWNNKSVLVSQLHTTVLFLLIEVQIWFPQFHCRYLSLA